MGVSLANLKTVVSKDPPIGIVYGPPGIGKTTLASEFPATVFLQTEFSAIEGVQLTSFSDDALTNFGDVMKGISDLYNDDHAFKTLCIDSIDALEPLLFRSVCARNNWTDIEQPGYGKGYIAADEAWLELFTDLKALRRDRQMNVLLIGHSYVERFDDPQSTSYSRYDFRAQKRGHAILEDNVDMLLFINQDPTIKIEKQGFNKERARAEGGHSRWIHTERRPVWNAKNRYKMPSQILYEPGKGYAAMKQYLPGQDVAIPGAKKAKAA